MCPCSLQSEARGLRFSWPKSQGRTKFCVEPHKPTVYCVLPAHTSHNHINHMRKQALVGDLQRTAMKNEKKPSTLKKDLIK